VRVFETGPEGPELVSRGGDYNEVPQAIQKKSRPSPSFISQKL